MKLLILSVSIGDGHLKAAEAIRLYAKKHCPEIEVKEVDYLKYVSYVADKIIVDGYISTLKLVPMLYGKIYSESKDHNLKKISGVFNKISQNKMEELIEEFEPDVIACTHPFPIETIAALKQKRIIDVPTIAVITDYNIHPRWIYDDVDGFIVPNEDFIEEVMKMGISKQKIYPFGIPVAENFSDIKAADKTQLMAELGFDNSSPIVLLMGGGLGLGHLSEIFEELLSSELEFQTIVCAGSNEDLVSDLEQLYSESGKRKKVAILGYTNKVNLLMAISAAIITKPGGLTITEAMQMRLPIIIKYPLPGHEEENADYLLNAGIALSSNYKSISQLLGQILYGGNSTRVNYIRQMEAEKTKSDSSNRICELLIVLSKKDELKN